MVYTSPTKVVHVVELHKAGRSHNVIAKDVDLHRTTVGCLLKKFKKSGPKEVPSTSPPHYNWMQVTRAWPSLSSSQV
ncbi:hypothetical protein AX16_001827 [Volvariella volvacea WC 439]|nr:hypothetical protein AX16_001827 [Volvariella volvacea WC 439]